MDPSRSLGDALWPFAQRWGPTGLVLGDPQQPLPILVFAQTPEGEPSAQVPSLCHLLVPGPLQASVYSFVKGGCVLTSLGCMGMGSPLQSLAHGVPRHSCYSSRRFPNTSC